MAVNWATDWAAELTGAFIAAREVFGVSFRVIQLPGGATVTNPQTYYGVQRETSEMLPLQSGGFVEDFDGGLEVLNTEISPVIGSIISINSGPLMRVAYSKSSNEDPVTLLYLIGVNK
jgi:hypothetical protein